METTLESTAKHTVKLTVEVPPEEFGKDLARAYRKVAQQVKIPGFRKGKVSTRFLADHESDLAKKSDAAIPLIAAALASMPHDGQRTTDNGQRVPTVWDTLGSWGRG